MYAIRTSTFNGDKSYEWHAILNVLTSVFDLIITRHIYLHILLADKVAS